MTMYAIRSTVTDEQIDAASAVDLLDELHAMFPDAPDDVTKAVNTLVRAVIAGSPADAHEAFLGVRVERVEP